MSLPEFNRHQFADGTYLRLILSTMKLPHCLTDFHGIRSSV